MLSCYEELYESFEKANAIMLRPNNWSHPKDWDDYLVTETPIGK